MTFAALRQFVHDRVSVNRCKFQGPIHPFLPLAQSAQTIPSNENPVAVLQHRT
jgi:hypothetical protein